ncbi:MAG: nucleotidyltransferase family protein [bacterium]|nr:nucleotidyltransferase family protein [bacterium]
MLTSLPTWTTPERRLIRACLHIGMPESCIQEATALIRDHEIDWEYVTGIMERSKVRALCYTNLLALPHGILDPALRTRLQEYVTRAAWRAMRSKGELIAILRAFQGAGIETVLFKGVMLAEAAYGSILLREFSDHDLLIRREAAEAAREALAPLGYKASHTIDALKRLRRRADALYHTGDGLSLDLHWQLIEDWRNHLGDLDPFREHTQATTWNGFHIRVFQDEFLLIFLCLHGYRHQWERFSWIVDLTGFIQRHPRLDWARVETLTQTYGVADIVEMGLLLAHDVTDCPLPPHILARLQTNTKICALLPTVYSVLFPDKRLVSDYSPRGREQTYRFQFMLVRRWFRVRLLYRMMIGRIDWRPNAADRAWVQLPPPLGFLYVVLRPLRLVVQYSGSQVRQLRYVIARRRTPGDRAN